MHTLALARAAQAWPPDSSISSSAACPRPSGSTCRLPPRTSIGAWSGHPVRWTLTRMAS